MPPTAPPAAPATVPVTVPGGFPGGEGWARTVHLRPLTGVDEIELADDPPQIPAATRATRLLARCVHAPDGGPAGAGFVRELTLGDREALLLHLRTLSAGSRVPCVLNCPECGERLELGLDADELLLVPYDREGDRHDLTVEIDARPIRVAFRLPNGGDQEAVAALARTHPDRVAGRLAARCVLGVHPTEHAETGAPAEDVPDPVHPALVQRLAERMAELDPQAEILVSLTCPDCGHQWRALFDAFRYLAAEVERTRGRLDREIHLLAYHYGWSEAEILGLPAPRRRRYARYLAGRLEGRGSA